MPGQNLTRQEAAERAQLLAVESYEVALDVATGPTTFAVSARIRFSCTTPGASTFLDFIGPRVEDIVLNGRRLDAATAFADSRIALPDLAADNDVTITATGAYMNTGEGLHRFVDPVDAQTYLYSQFEVADCRRMFPVFDQPDLKARFSFTVTAPAAWSVISTQPTPEPEPAGTRRVAGDDGAEHEIDVATWVFAPTPPLSSYVTALIAGPYASVRDEITLSDGRVVPLGLFCRASLLPHLDADNLFDLTKRGFAFFDTEFGLPYPFEKYDQIFTPEYNAGAMENVGAVTFNEMYVFRARVPDALVERRGLTILHELAHMWFGNLVTMRWWDDLWLNESFAEWASSTAQAEATQWTQAWTTFSTAEKAWAYQQDQLSSTHPISADMRHLDDVAVNFDGITYAKGASVLAQLVAYVGREAFTAGLRSYFAAHAWGNTTLADLLAELEKTSGRDLDRWSRLWLRTAGVNTLRLDADTDPDGVITAARITQTAPETHPTLRPHRMAVGLYDLDGESLVRRHRVELDVDGESTEVPELVGHRRPDLLLVNDDDLAYGKIRLDAPSLSTALAHPLALTGLPRTLVLGAAWDMARDAEMTASDFLALATGVLDADLGSTLLRHTLGRIDTALHLYLAPEHREAAGARVCAALRAAALGAPPSSDAQLQLVTAFATHAATPEDLDTLEGWLEGRDVPPGLAVDTEMRWTLLTGLVAGGRVDEPAIAAEEERDPTATGRERAARARAARPTPEAKAWAWAQALDRDALPNQTIDALWQGFGRVHDIALLEPYVEKYHQALDGVWRDRTHAIAESIVEGFYPVRLADRRLVERTQAWLDAHAEAPDGLVRLVSERRDGVARALSAQAADAAPRPR